VVWFGYTTCEPLLEKPLPIPETDTDDTLDEFHESVALWPGVIADGLPYILQVGLLTTTAFTVTILLQVTVWPLLLTNVPEYTVVWPGECVTEPDDARPLPMLVIEREVALDEFHDTVTFCPAVIESLLTEMLHVGATGWLTTTVLLQ